MIAADNEYLNEASQTIYHMNSDYWIRKACIEREEYHLDMRRFQTIIAEQEEALAEKDEALAMKDSTITEQEEALVRQDDIIRQLKVEIELLKNQQQSDVQSSRR